ncbi:hypothetical protein ACP70R_008802 [Stipagrostis hirtigluma subsp. patula]
MGFLGCLLLFVLSGVLESWVRLKPACDFLCFRTLVGGEENILKLSIAGVPLQSACGLLCFRSDNTDMLEGDMIWPIH